MDKILEERFHAIRNDLQFIGMDNPGQRYSTSPIGSFGYRNCNGVVLLGLAGDGLERTAPSNGVVLTHYGRTQGTKKEYDRPLTEEEIFRYMNRAIASLRRAGVEEIVAAVVGGDKAHFDTIVDFLSRHNIDANYLHCDGSPDEITANHRRPNKHIMVSPLTEEAILCIDDADYIRLL